MARTRTNRRRNRRGFTLMEVLLVMAILVIMASLVTFSYITIQKNAQSDHAMNQINVFKSAIDRYMMDMGAPPQTLEELRYAPQGLENPKKWRGPYVDQDIPNDPWQQPYQYDANAVDEYNNSRPVISSAGPDRTPGSQDDISNVQVTTQ